MAELWYFDLSPFTRAHGMAFKMRDQIISAQTPYQRIDIFDSYAFGKLLALDGTIQLSQRDEFIYHEMLAHVPILTHPSPQHLLIIGGGDGCCLREALKHPLESITLVDIDRQVVDLCRTHLALDQGAFSASKARILHDDGASFIRHHRQAFDVIILDATDAPCEASKTLLTRAFYEDCYDALTHQGVLVMQGGASLLEHEVLRGLMDDFQQRFALVSAYAAWVPSFAALWPFVIATKGDSPLNPRTADISTKFYSRARHVEAFSLVSIGAAL